MSNVFSDEVSKANFKLVREASDRYRRAGNKLDRARKVLRVAEREHEEATKELRLAIAAVQPDVLAEPVPVQVELPCCPAGVDDPKDMHRVGCPLASV